MELTLLATCFMLVACAKDVDELKARLVQGTNNTATSKGRLEILHNGTWSTVCDDRFGKIEAEVACRMLGLNSTRSLAVRSSMYGQGSGSIILDDVRCQGSEANLGQCKHRGLYTHNCKHDEDVGIICSEKPEQVRLTGTDFAVPDTGRVEIKLDSEWFTVIVPDDNFAKVACRQRRLPSFAAVVTQASSFTQSQSTQLMVHLDCKGNESNILDCDQLTDSESCRQLDFGVLCSNQVQLKARLVNGSSSYNGLLEVSHNESYVSVCSYKYLNALAVVACKTLEPNSSKAVAVHHSMYGDSKGTQFMEINCWGRENRLTKCQHGLVNNARCSTADSIGVICSNHKERLRLTGTSRTRQDMGRVEIQLADKWYSVCIDDNVATTVCQLLNLPRNEAVPLWESPGTKEPERLLIRFYCRGWYPSLLGCQQMLIRGYCSSDSNFYGVYCSNSVSLLIHPEGMMYPLTEGTNVTFKCGYRNQTLYNVTWPENAGGVPNGSKLMIDNVTRTHNGSRVRCEAMYKTENLPLKRLTSDTLELQVYYQPSILITSNLTTCRPQPPQNVCVVTHNTSVTIVCEADSNPPPASITWSGPVSSGTQELHLTPANSSTHQGFYTCGVFTQSRDEDERLPLSSNYTFAVVIQDRPAVVSFQLNGVNNQSVTVNENSDVDISCVATGRPNITIIEELNKQELRRRSQEVIRPFEKEQSDLNFTLSDVGCQQSGDYRCEVNNELGNDSQTVRLLVRCAPKLENMDRVVNISNSKGRLSFKMTSYPAPTNVTFQNVAASKARSHTSLLNDKLHVTCVPLSTAPASLTCDLSVANLTQTDKGPYRVILTNSLGNTSFVFTLTGELGIQVKAKSTSRETIKKNQ